MILEKRKINKRAFKLILTAAFLFVFLFSGNQTVASVSLDNIPVVSDVADQIQSSSQNLVASVRDFFVNLFNMRKENQEQGQAVPVNNIQSETENSQPEDSGQNNLLEDFQLRISKLESQIQNLNIPSSKETIRETVREVIVNNINQESLAGINQAIENYNSQIADLRAEINRRPTGLIGGTSSVQPVSYAPNEMTFVPGGSINSLSWAGSIISPAYGGTGQNFTGIATGTILYASSVGTIGQLAAGTSTWTLASNGADSLPTWTSTTTLLSNLGIGSGYVTYADASTTAWDTAFYQTNASSTSWSLAAGIANILNASSTDWSLTSGLLNASSTDWSYGGTTRVASSTAYSLAAGIVNASSTSWSQSAGIVNASSTEWSAKQPYNTRLTVIGTLATTTGNLIVGNGGPTGWSAFPIGGDGECLVATSSQSLGVTWTTCSGGGGGGVTSLNVLTGAVTITGSSTLSVTSGGGVITISQPQDLGMGASPTFANLTVSGTLTYASTTNWDNAAYQVNASSSKWSYGADRVIASSTDWSYGEATRVASNTAYSLATNQLNASSTDWSYGGTTRVASNTAYSFASGIVNASSTSWSQAAGIADILNASSTSWSQAAGIVNASSTDWSYGDATRVASTTAWTLATNQLNASSTDWSYGGTTRVASNTAYSLTSGIVSASSTSWSQAAGIVNVGSWRGNVIGISYGGTGTSTNFTAGSIVFSNGITYSQNNANLFWDNANTRLGVGTTTPAYTVDIYGTLRAATSSFGQITAAGNVLPATTTAYNLGSSDYKWGNIYAATATIGNTITINSNTISGSGTTTLNTSLGSIILNPTSYVGIGTTTPEHILDVYGTARGTNLQFTGNLVQDGFIRATTSDSTEYSSNNINWTTVSTTTIPRTGDRAMQAIKYSVLIKYEYAGAVGGARLLCNGIPISKEFISSSYSYVQDSFSTADIGILAACGFSGNVILNTQIKAGTYAGNPFSTYVDEQSFEILYSKFSPGFSVATSSNSTLYSSSGGWTTVSTTTFSITGDRRIQAITYSFEGSELPDRDGTVRLVCNNSPLPEQVVFSGGGGSYSTSTYRYPIANPSSLAACGFNGNVVLNTQIKTNSNAVYVWNQKFQILYSIGLNEQVYSLSSLKNPSATNLGLLSFGSDIAEYIYSDEYIEPGSILSVDTNGAEKVKESSVPYDSRLLGVVSTKPFIINSQEKGNTLIALAGRVPVKISDINGSIKAGDLLTSSDIPGIAMKATDPGMVIGTALENYDATGTSKIIVFVNVHWSIGSLDIGGSISNAASATDTNSAIKLSVMDKFTLIIKNALEKLGMFIENGMARFKQVRVERLEMIDRATGDIYCSWIENGDLVRTKGECGSSQEAVSASTEIVTDSNVSSDNSQSEEIFIEDNSTSTEGVSTSTEEVLTDTEEASTNTEPEIIDTEIQPIEEPLQTEEPLQAEEPSSDATSSQE